MNKQTNRAKCIETDDFPFEFLSKLAERESWRKEVHRPIYHVHKWWAKRLGSVFRGMLLGCVVDGDVEKAFYEQHDFGRLSVLDPFMGSGTTIGEAHKLGFKALGRDINPVAVDAVRVALGPLDEQDIERAFGELDETVGKEIRELYRSLDSMSRPCDVLYRFWVMQAACPSCEHSVDLFSSFIFAKNAYPKRKPEVQIVCPECRRIFQGMHTDETVSCVCGHCFNPRGGPVKGAKATCSHCSTQFSVLKAIDGKRPSFREYAKLVLTQDGEKEYLQTTKEDAKQYEQCSIHLEKEMRLGKLAVPKLSLEHGHNTRQAMSYGFHFWKDFFNDRQLLALAMLQKDISKIENTSTRDALLTLFSGVLEFNNLFASYKGEGTGAVRHMFAHHILKPERTPIEANVWGTPRSSGAFSTLYRSKLLRAIRYRQAPTEINGTAKTAVVCSRPMTGQISDWPESQKQVGSGIALSCGDSASTALASRSIDLVVTDPPFFDNVHYSELADFFQAWKQTSNGEAKTTRRKGEVQDSDAASFADKLRSVFAECHRVLRDDGLLVFTYHHSREDGWQSVAEAVLAAGFVVVNAQPVKSEMSVATPKSQAKEPIQLDTILVCRKQNGLHAVAECDALESAKRKTIRLENAGFKLSKNDRKVILYGQLLTTMGQLGDRLVLPDIDDQDALKQPVALTVT